MPSANPEVEDTPNPELADVEEVALDETEVEAEPTPTEPTTAGGEATSRRSRAEARGERQGKTAVNLDALPEFRAWKAETDRRQTALEAELRSYRDTVAQQQEARQQAEIQELAERLDDTVDPSQRQALVEQMAGIRAQTYVRQWQTWAAYVADEVTKAGLDPKTFDATKYKAREQFERDLLEAKAKKLETELSELKQRQDPQAFEKIIQKRVAEALSEHGFDVVETATPTEPPSSDMRSWQRDSQLVQLGQMSPTAYLKKWGDKTPT